MKKRLLLVAVLTVCAMLVLPGAAFASKRTIKYHGVHSVYVVSQGSNLTAGGWVTSNKSPKRWDGMRFEIERKINGKWKDITVFWPSAGGTFTFFLHNPPAATYRVHYDGDSCYGIANDVFVIVRPAKVDPELSVTAPRQVMMQFGARSLEADSVVVWLLEAKVHTGQPAGRMLGTHLHITALGSLTGATYTVVYPVPPSTITTSFGGSTDVTVGPYPIPRLDGTGNPWGWFKFKADWDGNEFTNPGSATSDPLHILPN